MKVGIICDLSYDRHHLFKSYFHAVKNLYKQQPVVVKEEKDLQGVDILFIGDDHYEPHKQVWMKCVKYCNENKIKVVALTNEKVKNSYFPWNETNLKKLNEFENLYHYMNDVDDCIEYGCKIHRTAPSYAFEKILKMTGVKKYNNMVFIGKIDCSKNSYNERKELLSQIQKKFKIDIYSSSIPTWVDYISILKKYRFIFSPIGNGNFFPMRFYEALAVSSIPIHQVRKNTLEYYDVENIIKEAVYFEDINEIQDKIDMLIEQESHSPIWMEDSIGINLLNDNLL